MQLGRFFCAALLLITALPSVSMTRNHRNTTSSTKHAKAAAKHTTGQRSIDDARASEIQAALVRTGYMVESESSGHWDSATESAMQKFQSDNGWQTKLMPDSRAIIKLGLGPSQPAFSSTGASSIAASGSESAINGTYNQQ